MNEIHEANRAHWDAAADGWRELREEDQVWSRGHREPALVRDGQALEMIREFIGDLPGKEACVIGSGDDCCDSRFERVVRWFGCTYAPGGAIKYEE